MKRFKLNKNKGKRNKIQAHSNGRILRESQNKWAQILTVQQEEGGKCFTGYFLTDSFPAVTARSSVSAKRD